MQIQVHYQGLEHTPWMDDFINARVSKLDRFLTPAAHVQVHIKLLNSQYVTSLSVHNQRHDYAFSSDGVNLYESFSTAILKASRVLSEEKKKIKDRIHRRFNERLFDQLT